MVVGTEPGSVPPRAARGDLKVTVRLTGIELGITGGDLEIKLLVRRTAVGVCPFGVGAGDS